MTKKYEIIWEAVPDPFKNGMIPPPMLKTNHPIYDSFEEEDDDDGDEEDIYDEDTPNSTEKMAKLVKGIITPLGILPVNESWNPLNAYFGHTNFVITRNILHIIQASEGVEGIKALTPYRFKVCFAKYWHGKEKNLQKKIEAVIFEYFEKINKEN